MSHQRDLEELAKRCERSITKLTVENAFAHIGLLIDDAFDASFERGAKRALFCSTILPGDR